ncbi:hypothetical protein [Flavisolibacter tropicus]|uniref:Uncharacterized protein n=1 Tax=Flavisolibacter tropicus TaxID=1492898 RepID=A0A172TXU2_9BACT|nr:hypothetical protein [Flavisolibacter tropicus]ANE51788.1 hypothetical protein SY85_16110 [Flavisolibacter tropicus]
MQRALGKILLSVGLFIFVFFLYYRGDAIPIKELWFALSFFVMATGAYLIIKHKLYQTTSQSSHSDNKVDEIKHLILNGEKVNVTLDNSEVKSRSYQQELIKDGIPSKIEMLNAVINNERNYSQEVIVQTYIVFLKEYNDQTYKFVSPVTSWNEVAVKMYMDRKGGLDLYVDKNNPANYYFDFPFL